MRWILLWNMPLAQDRSLDLLTSSPALYRCTKDAPLIIAKMVRTLIDTYIQTRERETERERAVTTYVWHNEIVNSLVIEYIMYRFEVLHNLYIIIIHYTSFIWFVHANQQIMCFCMHCIKCFNAIQNIYRSWFRIQSASMQKDLINSDVYTQLDSFA